MCAVKDVDCFLERLFLFWGCVGWWAGVGGGFGFGEVGGWGGFGWEGWGGGLG